MGGGRGQGSGRVASGGRQGRPCVQPGTRRPAWNAGREPAAAGGPGPRTDGTGELDIRSGRRSVVSAPIGILAMAYGTASGPEDVERYYTDIRGGRPPTEEHLAELRARYAAIGDRFPLLEITRAQGAALEAELNREGGAGFAVYLGMKHSA